MSGAREEILGRIRRALSDVPVAERPDDVPVARAYARHAPAPVEDLLQRFAERVADYHAEVRRIDAAALRSEVSEACVRRGLQRVVVPPDLPAEWRPDGVIVVEDHGLPVQEVDAANGALTGCAAAVAETGTVILDGQGNSGRRALTLVPDHHICIVHRDQVVASVPEAIARLAPAVIERRAPVTLVSGPSATSDIELFRVEGVHGPRHLLVLIVQDDLGGHDRHP